MVLSYFSSPSHCKNCIKICTVLETLDERAAFSTFSLQNYSPKLLFYPCLALPPLELKLPLVLCLRDGGGGVHWEILVDLTSEVVVVLIRARKSPGNEG